MSAHNSKGRNSMQNSSTMLLALFGLAGYSTYAAKQTQSSSLQCNGSSSPSIRLPRLAMQKVELQKQDPSLPDWVTMGGDTLENLSCRLSPRMTVSGGRPGDRNQPGRCHARSSSASRARWPAVAADPRGPGQSRTRPIQQNNQVRDKGNRLVVAVPFILELLCIEPFDEFVDPITCRAD